MAYITIRQYGEDEFIEKKSQFIGYAKRCESEEEAKAFVAEIKSTVPYLKNDFGSNQKISIRNDIRKLKESSADIKIMFVTDPLAYEILRDKYIDINDKINLVLLTE